MEYFLLTEKLEAWAKKQLEVFNDFNKVLTSDITTNIIYEDSYTVNDNLGNATTIIPRETGGESTLLVKDNPNFSQNFIVINPRSAQNIQIFKVTDNYYNTYGTVQMQTNEPNFIIETIVTNVSNLTWHGIGHVIYAGETQDKVLDFDNKTRKIMNMPKRPYDETHNKKIK